MQDSKDIIRQTKKKFFIYSTIGILLVLGISFLGLRFHNQIVSKQASMQQLYIRVGNQFAIISKISALSERFDDIQSPKMETELREKFSFLLQELNKENESLSQWLNNNTYAHVEKIEDLLTEKETGRKMLSYITVAKKLLENTDGNFQETRKNIKYLSKSSREGIGEVLTRINSRIASVQGESLSELNRTGFFLVSLCVLQIILVWLLVFRPLYSTITLQHHKLSSALLSAKSASRSKTDFLANISHEIRTPMTAILGYAELLKREAANKKERLDSVKIINQNASHLLSLIDEILDISKIEAGKFDFENENVHLSTLLNEVYSLIHVKSKEKGIEIAFRNKGKIPETIQSDPKRIKQILFNILGNAIKFTHKGYVELVVSYKEKINKVSIRVKDTGMGINPEQRKKLFKPFEQGNTSVNREYGGTGLGLVLSKGMAKGMGGDIKIVDSKVGVGTTFEILLDAGDPKGLEMVKKFSTNIIDSKKSDEKLEDLLKGRKILVVDDAIENARLFQTYLKEAGADVKVANNGQFAIDLASEFFFDIILLDLQMPGKDGFQVISELREKSFTRPIVALTAHAMKEEKDKTKAAGFDFHITKPVKADFLIKSVASIIEGNSVT